MNPGTRVRLTSDPGRIGVTTGQSRLRGGRSFWQVTFSDGSQYISQNQLELISSDIEDALDFFKKGKFGRARDLRGAITHIRLSGRLADLIYSMETTNTDFYPYQFKPVLNFLESPSSGILIADEVGLGKTIEAGLIWTELRSRYDTRRLMVLCPAMLRDKWKLELQRRFGINASIVDTDEALKTLKGYKAGDLNEFAIIASMQGLRPNKGWEDDTIVARGASTKLARFLSENTHDEPLIDLLIVDEAHYLRNPQSMTSRLGRLLRDVAEHVVLLSATPIHLRNEDLYYLLNLVDEDSFNQVHVFDYILDANAPLIRARDMILRGNVDIDEFLGQLEEAKDHVLLSNNRQLQALLNNPPSAQDLRTNVFRSQLAHRLESINLLGHAVTRTRKREVTEWRVIREAIREVIELTPVEVDFYNRVTKIVREYCLNREAHEGFLLVTPQRQISSSMPAALREWQNRKFKFENMYEDIGEDVEDGNEKGPLVQTIYKKTRIFWHINLGIPSSNYDDLKMRKTFKTIAMAAWRISRLESTIAIDDVKKYLKEAERHMVTKGKDIHQKEYEDQWIDPDFVNTHPEVIMEVVGYARSPMRTEGLHLIVDVGATTLDVATFIIHKKNKEDVYPLMDATVERLGTLMLHNERIQAVITSLERSLGQANSIDQRNPLPDHSHYGIKVSKKDVLERDDMFFDKCAIAISGTVQNTKRQRDPFSHVWHTELPVFVCGGGGRHKLYRKTIVDLGQSFSRSWNGFDGFTIKDIPKPPHLDAVDLAHDEYDRLAVAYGLSFTSDEIGEVVPESQTDDIVVQPVVSKLEDRYISKEMC